ncbi:uncharacterized protein LOC135433732 [Drosophila montana]|uniref:uncharacterized protein LOC135433732 n=1 Tax=Drosophila montana TaxID=40370 RepID=UPI00313C7688
MELFSLSQIEHRRSSGCVSQRRAVGERSCERSGGILGEDWSSSNHWCSGDAIVVAGKHLAAGSSHIRSWSCNHCSRSSSYNWSAISQLLAQEKTRLGRSTGDDCEDNNGRCHLCHLRLCCSWDWSF